MTTATDLTAFMAAHKLNARRLADALGYSKSAIYDMLNASRPIPIFIGLALAALDQGLKPYAE